MLSVYFILVKTDEDFETTVVGMWMKKWEMVNTNRHTDKFVQSELQPNVQFTSPFITG